MHRDDFKMCFLRVLLYVQINPLWTIFEVHVSKQLNTGLTVSINFYATCSTFLQYCQNMHTHRMRKLCEFNLNLNH